MTFEPDEVMVRVGAAMALAGRGDRDAACTRFGELWVEVGADGDPFHRVAIAHALADLQDDVHDEIMWDERALIAAEALTDARVAAGGAPGSARSFLPSAHLNLADDRLRLGDAAAAREHVAAGRAALDTLAADGYRQMISDALDRIDAALG